MAARNAAANSAARVASHRLRLSISPLQANRGQSQTTGQSPLGFVAAYAFTVRRWVLGRFTTVQSLAYVRSGRMIRTLAGLAFIVIGA